MIGTGDDRESRGGVHGHQFFHQHRGFEFIVFAGDLQFKIRNDENGAVSNEGEMSVRTAPDAFDLARFMTRCR